MGARRLGLVQVDLDLGVDRPLVVVEPVDLHEELLVGLDGQRHALGQLPVELLRLHADDERPDGPVDAGGAEVNTVGHRRARAVEVDVVAALGEIDRDAVNLGGLVIRRLEGEAVDHVNLFGALMPREVDRIWLSPVGVASGSSPMVTQAASATTRRRAMRGTVEQ